jgi:hypothetical protein
MIKYSAIKKRRNASKPELGSGFSKRQIELFRQLYRTFPIANALHSQLSSVERKE